MVDRAVAAAEVHLWWASLRVPPERLARLEALLTGDERTRADRFRFARDRARFVVARGMLREILGRYLDRDPAALRFAYGAHGKPALAETSTGLRFNLAHSGDAALFAVRWERDIGVDLEPVRTDLDLGELAAIVLTPGERALL
ncbi:MAG: phosphopantetheinyl transferase, partial [Chloroflexia bacterium]|nr:phosphopantetheinyl transferase [Chloroflexia bacterium]